MSASSGLIQKFHHVAFRCRDAKETVDFYRDVLGMGLVGCMAEDRVPSTHEPDPYMHVFLDAGGGSILAFFELPNSPPMDRDHNTPVWVQHIALQVADVDTLERTKAKLQGLGLDVVGVTDHTIFKSIYFHDPNGHRLELSTWTATPEQVKRLRDEGPEMIEEWARTRKPPKISQWVHEKEFS